MFCPMIKGECKQESCMWFDDINSGTNCAVNQLTLILSEINDKLDPCHYCKDIDDCDKTPKGPLIEACKMRES